MRGAIETERLIIRRFQLGDWREVWEYTSDPDVMKFLPEEPFTEEKAMGFVKSNMDSEPRHFPVILKSQDTVIGHMAFYNWFADSSTYEMGWVLNRRYHGQGYATEAARDLMKYGFMNLNLHRIIASCTLENKASQRVMERLGMRRQARLRKCIRIGGKWHDEYLYAILYKEWMDPLKKLAKMS